MPQVVMIQMAATVLMIVALPSGLHFGSLRDVLRWALTIPFLFTLMLASSMLALDHASMGFIIVIRNIAPSTRFAFACVTLRTRRRSDGGTSQSKWQPPPLLIDLTTSPRCMPALSHSPHDGD
jgi:hypothetical protein